MFYISVLTIFASKLNTNQSKYSEFMALPVEIRKEIKKRLPYGTLTKIASELDITSAAVCNYINGRGSSKRIEDAILIECKYLKEEEDEKMIIANEFINSI